MQKKQRYITAGVTLAAAVTAAHLMQRGSGGPAPEGAAQVAGVSAASAAGAISTPGPASESIPHEIAKNEVILAAAEVAATPEPMVEIAASDALPRPPRDVLMPTPLPQVGAELQNRMANTVSVVAEPAVEQPRRSEFGLTCGPILSASVGDAAMVALTLTAPCRGQQRVIVRHGDLAFSGRLDRLGTYSADIPALQADANFTVTFPDGESVTADLDVPTADDLRRVALAFQGDAALQIHALEFGADYGDEGHVWAGRPRDVDSAARASGGFLVTLGDASLEVPMLAEVYTFPQDTKTRDGVVRLSVEAEVTAFNCETEVAGQTLERAADGAISVVSMTVAIPECTAIGEFLVLKNLLRDMKIASN